MRTLIPSLLFASLIFGSSGLVQGKNPEADIAKKDVASQLVGYWGVNVNKTKEGLAKAAEEAGVEAKEELESATEMITEMADKIVLQFTAKAKAIGYTEDGKEPASFKIVNEDPATGNFTMEIVEDGDEDEDTNVAICRLQADDFRMTMEGEKMIIHFQRLSKKVAKKRIAEFQGEKDQ